MRRVHFLLLVLTLILGFSIAVYAGTKSTQLQVSATVESIVDVTTIAVNFGVIDPSVSNSADGFIVVTAPEGTPYTITLSGGFNNSDNIRHIGGFFNGIPYQLFQPDLITEWGDNAFEGTFPTGSPFNATGTGAPQSHLVHGVTQATENSVGTGTLSDQVQVTVHF